MEENSLITLYKPTDVKTLTLSVVENRVLALTDIGDTDVETCADERAADLRLAEVYETIKMEARSIRARGGYFPRIIFKPRRP